MDFEVLIKFLASFGILLIGIMAKYSNNDGWTPVKKYWLLIVLIGTISLIVDIFRYII